MTATLRFKNIVKKLTPPSRTRSLANNLTDNDSRLWVLLISKKNFLRANGWHLGRYFTPTKVTKHRKLNVHFSKIISWTKSQFCLLSAPWWYWFWAVTWAFFRGDTISVINFEMFSLHFNDLQSIHRPQNGKKSWKRCFRLLFALSFWNLRAP